MRVRGLAQLDTMDASGACAFLKPGVRVEVTRTFLEGAPGTAQPVGVRVFGSGATTDGFSRLEMIADR